MKHAELRQGGRRLNARRRQSTAFAWIPSIIQLRTTAERVFVPVGYPSSVRPGYARFMIFGSLSTVFSAGASFIASTALLGSFFQHSAAWGWLAKDLLPNVVSVFAASRLGDVDEQPTTSLMQAQTLSQSAIVCEVLLAAASESIASALPLCAMVTSAAKGCAMIRHSSARVSMLQHFATVRNVGDLQAKLQSSAIFCYSFGSAVGLLLLHSVLVTTQLQIATVVLLSTLSVLCTYLSTTAVVLTHLTPTVLQLQVQSWTSNGEIISPAAVAQLLQRRHGLKEALDGSEGSAKLEICPEIVAADDHLEGLLGRLNDMQRVIISRDGGVVCVHAHTSATTTDIISASLVAHAGAEGDEYDPHRPAPDTAKFVEALAAHGWQTDATLFYSRRLNSTTTPSDESP